MLPPKPADRIRLLRWAFPISLGVISILYQLGPARWVHDNYSHAMHYVVEIVFYGIVGPMVVYLALGQIGRWLDEKERAEKQVQASEQRLASITTASADAILALDARGLIESWNRGAELIFGYAADQIRGRPLYDLFGGGEAAELEADWLINAVREAGFIRGHETRGRDAAGREIAVDLTATRLADETGSALGLSVILRDITERKRREQEIRRLNASLSEQIAERTRELAEKVEALAQANADLQQLDRMRSEFVSLVSHQIRAPLTNMRGAVEHIQANCGVMNVTCLRMLAILDQQVERLDRLVREVLSANRIEAGELRLHREPISVLPVVKQVVEQMRLGQTGRRFRLPTKPGLPPVFADRDQVAEVLANLLDNADRYSRPGEAVIIEARADETGVTLSVRDLGPGLPPGDVERVFDKFYRIDSSDSQAVYGYGLGLYICRQLVEAHGGRIWAENHPDGGAVFSFTLPVAA